MLFPYCCRKGSVSPVPASLTQLHPAPLRISKQHQAFVIKQTSLTANVRVSSQLSFPVQGDHNEFPSETKCGARNIAKPLSPNNHSELQPCHKTALHILISLVIKES